MMSPYNAAQSYGVQYDIEFNFQKSVVNIAKKPRRIKRKTFLHSLRQMLWTKSDIWVISFGVSCCMWWRQCCKLCAQANMPACNSRCVQMRLKQPFSTVYCIRLYTPNSNIKMHPESRSSSQDGRVQAPLWQVTSPPLMPCWRNSCKFMCWLIDWKRNNGLNWANIKRHKAIIVLYCCARF